MTVAAPLVLMAVAVGASAYADHQRQKATDRIAELLEQRHLDKLEEERNELDGCCECADPGSCAGQGEVVGDERCLQSVVRRPDESHLHRLPGEPGHVERPL